jgi:tRNA(Ile)-lysidine synthase
MKSCKSVTIAGCVTVPPIQNNIQMALNLCIFKQIVSKLTQKKSFLIAYSGGIDSQVLLHLFFQWSQANPDICLRAVHVNHGLSRHALSWTSFANIQCNQYDIPCIVKHINMTMDTGEGIEAQARRLRYHAIQRVINADEVLCTAHNQNDQAETTMLNWLRGSGTAGLAGMCQSQTLYQMEILRPLLSFPRSLLAQFASQHQLKWVEDDSNTSLKFERNYIRQKIMPQLLASRRGSLNNLTRTADHCREASTLLKALALKDLNEIPHDTKKLNITVLLTFNEARQRNVLRYWLRAGCGIVPTTRQLQVLQKEVIQASADADPILHVHHKVLRRYRSTLYIENALPFDPGEVQTWQWRQSSILDLSNGLGTLSAKVIAQGGLSKKRLVGKILTVCYRQGGERMQPSARRHSASLKHLFQEWHIPPWRRKIWPLVFCDNRLAAVPNLDIDRHFAANEGEPGVEIIWQFNSAEEKNQ